jgi:hypothetical protein
MSLVPSVLARHEVGEGTKLMDLTTAKLVVLEDQCSEPRGILSRSIPHQLWHRYGTNFAAAFSMPPRLIGTIRQLPRDFTSM